jgi:serine/threonine protein phosphatase PrpC
VLRAFGVTDKGSVRPANQDCFAIREELGLLVIADGMGGHNAGDVAARIAVDAIVDYFAGSQRDWPFGFDPSLSPDGNRLRTAILLANVQILETAVTTDRYAGMGTTVVAALVVDDRLVVGHVGDSRMYVMSGGALFQLTRDDSWMASVLATDPDADQAALQRHPMRHALTNVVGARTGTDVHVIERPLTPGDTLLMTTDGVHGVLDDQRLVQLMAREAPPRAVAEHIVATALARGTRDNLTAIVGRYQ